MSEGPHRDSWFEKAGPSSGPPSSLPPSSLPPPRPAGDPARSAVMGAVAGAVGGVLAVLIGGGLHARALQDPPRLALTASAVAVAGAILGGAFGRLTRRLFRVVPRVAFAMTFASTLWLFTYAFVLLRYVPVVARAVAFGPSMLGALVYGVCVGAAPPVRMRRERGRGA